MRKRLIGLITTCTLSCNLLFGQNPAIDSLKNKLSRHMQQDTARVNLLNTLALEIRRMDRKQMIPYTEEALQLSTKLNYEKGEGRAADAAISSVISRRYCR